MTKFYRVNGHGVFLIDAEVRARSKKEAEEKYKTFVKRAGSGFEFELHTDEVLFLDDEPREPKEDVCIVNSGYIF